MDAEERLINDFMRKVMELLQTEKATREAQRLSQELKDDYKLLEARFKESLDVVFEYFDESTNFD